MERAMPFNTWVQWASTSALAFGSSLFRNMRVYLHFSRWSLKIWYYNTSPPHISTISHETSTTATSRYFHRSCEKPIQHIDSEIYFLRSWHINSGPQFVDVWHFEAHVLFQDTFGSPFWRKKQTRPNGSHNGVLLYHLSWFRTIFEARASRAPELEKWAHHPNVPRGSREYVLT